MMLAIQCRCYSEFRKEGSYDICYHMDKTCIRGKTPIKKGQVPKFIQTKAEWWPAGTRRKKMFNDYGAPVWDEKGVEVVVVMVAEQHKCI